MNRDSKMDWPAFLLFSSILLGALLRFMPAFMTGFPINDGGMFLQMTRDLQANHYLLPHVTTYNAMDIPYVYPPLGFYAASLLADVGRIPLLTVFLWLPPLLSLLAIPAFYHFARLLTDNLTASLAALLFAVTPGGYGWHIMGGGLTRSFGILFLLLTISNVYTVFREGKPRSLFLAALFGALAILSHPELGLQTAGLCAVLWLFLGRTWRSVRQSLLIAVGVLLLTAPWWWTVLSQYGFSPFLSAAQTGMYDSAIWLKFLTDNFSPEGFFPFLALLRLMGAGYAFLHRRWLLLALAAAPYLVEPRSSPSIAIFAFSMIAVLAFLQGLPALWKWLFRRAATTSSMLATRSGVVTLLVLILFQFIDCGLYNYRLVNTTLTVDERQAMHWLNANLPAGHNFLLLTGGTGPMIDPTQEWFPALTGQHSQTTLQGGEWILGQDFLRRLADLEKLQTCPDLACVDAWSARTGLGYDYLWLRLLPEADTGAAAQSRRELADSVLTSGKFQVVYRNEGTIILARAGQ